MGNPYFAKAPQDYFYFLTVVKNNQKNFSDKRHAIESIHMVEINKTSEQNFPKFLKLLGLEKDMKELKLA